MHLLHLFHSDLKPARTLYLELSNPSDVRSLTLFGLAAHWLAVFRRRIYSLSGSVDLGCVKQIDAVFVGQSHQLLCHLLREPGWEEETGERMG